MNNNAEFLKTSDVIVDVLEKSHEKRKKELGKNCSLSPSVNKTPEGDLGIVVNLEFICPKTRKNSL